MRIVLDSNVVIAAFAARGLCEAVLEYCLSGHEIVFSEQLLSEIKKGLHTKIKLPTPTVDGIISFLEDNSTLFKPESLSPDVCRDPDDIKVLGLASAAKADCIVTGDKDLLVLGSFRGIHVLSPRSFSDSIRKK